MNTLTFQDTLECQYFIEDLHIKGFRKDNSKSNQTTFSYVSKQFPDHRIVVNVQHLAADIYRNDKLVLHDKHSAKDNTTLAA